MNVSVGQKYRTKNRNSIFADRVYNVTAISENYNFGLRRGRQRAITLEGRKHSPRVAESDLESKYELIPA